MMYLFLTEAGDGIGFGHLTRMMAVGDALLELGVETKMLVQWEGVPQIPILEGRAWVQAEAWRHDPAAALARHGARAVLIDSYRLEICGYSSVTASGARLAVLDDFYRLPFPADLAVNPNVFGDPACYLPHAKHAVAGVEWVILRPALTRLARTFEVRSRLGRVLLTLGGSDVHGLGPQLSSAVAELGLDVVWVAPGQPVEPAHPRVTILGTQTAEGMARLVQSCDLVLCGGGQTLHELACLGAPFVAIELGDDQRLNLAFYERVGCLGPRLIWSSQTLTQDLARRLAALAPQEERSRLSETAGSLVDGKGARRLAAVLAEFIN
ncbi:MAG: hypothetical protein LDL31_03045 [Prosthecobacter sp.]|jgi:spore coat polysaccharide biosynthesis predicted glycosyltransferase SpsG|nr:hypothetical protein [Prosthecobacter sp.]